MVKILKRKWSWKWLLAIPLGLVIFLAQLWVYVNIEEWRSKIIIYMVMTATLFSLGAWRIEKGLFNRSFIKSLPKFLLFLAITLIPLSILAVIIGGQSLTIIPEALAGISLALILAHILVVSTSETYVFQGMIPEALENRGISKIIVYVLSAGIFAFFHFMTAGGIWILLLPYFALGLIFLYVGRKYTRRTLLASVGCHAGWNLFVLGFASFLI